MFSVPDANGASHVLSTDAEPVSQTFQTRPWEVLGTNCSTYWLLPLSLRHISYMRQGRKGRDAGYDASITWR